jgi:uncharacterized membrane protein (UPF0127 family)
MRLSDRRAALASLTAALLLAGCAGAEKAQAEPGAISPLEDLQVVTSTGAVHPFKVEIADEEPERRNGLMNRPSMRRDRGMLFQFEEESERSFWMKNTYIALDIIYIARDGRIVSIAARTTPFSEAPIASMGAANGVLEINGGLAEELGIRAGDTVRHPFFDNR